MPPEAQTTLIADRYALNEQIGKGGMGVVWRADDTLLKREVAIKEIRFPVELQESEGQKVGARVLREARAAAQLNHSGAVSVYDVLQGDNRAFIVMELVDAPTLDDIVKTEGPISEKRAAFIALELLDTLEAAHAQGIVHRDVKPANVMVSDSGAVKLADFGIASVRDDPRLTASGMILGSPAYMAPEQATESPGTPATDLWSLGATLFTAIEGHAPFEKANAIATLGAVLNDEAEFERAREIRPVIQKLLAKDPSERLTLPEARAALQEIADGDAASVAPTEVAAPATVVAPTRPVTEVARPAPPRTERAVARPTESDGSGRWLVALGVIALLGVLGWLAFNALSGDDTEPTKQAGTAQNEKAKEDPADETDDGAAAPVEGGETTETEAPAGEAVVPENWTPYTEETSGYQIAYPEGWTISGGGTSTDFRDGATGTYMRVQWTDAPGDDVIGRLEEIEADFDAEKENYARLRMEPVDFLDGWEAGEWEYTYEEGGAVLHAVNLQFVNGEYGFALNFQTRDQNWDVSQEIFEDFKASFVPPQ